MLKQRVANSKLSCASVGRSPATAAAAGAPNGRITYDAIFGLNHMNFAPDAVDEYLLPLGVRRVALLDADAAPNVLFPRFYDSGDAVGAALADEQVVLHDVCIDQQGLTTRFEEGSS